jgi:LPS-assembly protein
MSHYRRRAGISAHLLSVEAPRTLLGLGLLSFVLWYTVPVKGQNLGPVINSITPLLPSQQQNQTQQQLQNQAPTPIGDPPRPLAVGSLPTPTLVPSRGEVTVLKLDDQLRQGKAMPDNQALTFTFSDEIDGVVDREMKLKGRSQIRRNTTILKADEIIYDPDTDIADLIGNAQLIKDNTEFSGPRARFKVDARQGEMDRPSYELRDVRGRGKASKLTIETADLFVFDKATYTTCSPQNLDWYFTASRVEIDQEQKVMTGKNGVMRFFDVPIMYAPYFSLPTSNQRRSGLLSPTIGYNSNNGLDIAQPYYVNIAPNRDLTITPRFMNHRGTLLGSDFRYIDPKYSGTLSGQFLNYDKIMGRDRWKYDWQQRQLIAPAWNAYANMSKVSDSFYPIDFSYGIGGAVTNQFRQELGTNYGGIKNWNFTARTLTFQTLQPDPTAPVISPYNILPQVTANYSNRGNLNTPGSYAGTFGRGPDLTFSSDFTRFSYNTNNLYAPSSGMPQGGAFSQADRTVIRGSIAMPQVTPGYYIKPKLSFQASQYSASLSNSVLYQPNQSLNQPVQGFALPTLSLDSGLAFERDATEMKWFFGREMLVTMEPRAFYVYTPFQSQAQTPLFDTADAGFGVTQIYSENTFVGSDRVADSNKLTTGLTSRILEANTGAERATVTLAQRQDFAGQRVGLNGTIANPTRYSDTLGASTVRLMGNFNLDLFGQYNTQLNRFVQSSVGAGWRPTPGRSLNFAYRNVWNPVNDGTNSGITQTDQYNAFGEWPVFKKYRLLGRWGYDALTTKTLNTLVGLQYDEDCWTARFAYSQAMNTSQITTTQVLFQLEFRGFGSVGNNPVDVMRLNVPGYQPVAKPLPPSPYENYQ